MEMGWEKKASSNFFLSRRIRLKLVDFFYNLSHCNKKAKVLPLATALKAHLRSQFSHGFKLLISIPPFESINFC